MKFDQDMFDHDKLGTEICNIGALSPLEVAEFYPSLFSLSSPVQSSKEITSNMEKIARLPSQKKAAS